MIQRDLRKKKELRKKNEFFFTNNAGKFIKQQRTKKTMGKRKKKVLELEQICVREVVVANERVQYACQFEFSMLLKSKLDLNAITRSKN